MDTLSTIWYSTISIPKNRTHPFYWAFHHFILQYNRESRKKKSSTITKEHIRIEWHARTWAKSRQSRRKKKRNRNTFSAYIFVNRKMEKNEHWKVWRKCRMLFIILLSTFLCIFHVSLNIVLMSNWLLYNPWSFKAQQGYTFTICVIVIASLVTSTKAELCVCWCAGFKLCALLYFLSWQARLTIAAIIQPYIYEYWSQIVSLQ